MVRLLHTSGPDPMSVSENSITAEEDEGTTGSKRIVSNLVDFLCGICPGLLSTEIRQSDLLDSGRGGSNAYALLERFTTSVELSTLFIEVVPQLNGGGSGELTSPASIVQPGVVDVVGKVRLSLETGSWRGGTSVALIKRFLGSSLSPDQPMGSQLQIMNFPNIGDGNGVFEILQVYIQCAFTPVTVAAQLAAGADNKGAAAASSGSSGEVLTRRLKELELALSQCQKQLKIPSVHLQPHPEVVRALSHADEGVSLDIEAIGLSNLPDGLLNEIQAGINDWVRDIRRLTQLTSLPFSGTALEEVAFWHGLGEALQATTEELESPGVTATVMLLKQAKRYLATVALDTNTGLKDALDVASDINTFLRGFPIDALVSVNDLVGLTTATPPIFNHFGRLKNSKYYPLERAAQLMESVETAFTNQLTTILATRPIMALDYPTFEVVSSGAKSVIESWSTGYSKFREFFEARCRKQSRILSQRLNGAEILGKLTMNHIPLAARLSEVAHIRSEFERFCKIVHDVFESEDWEGGGASALRDITATYEPLLTVDALDLSSVGCVAWAACKEAYEGRRDKVEGRMASLLCEKLQRTSSAEEMFNVFAQFNQMFIRPRIRVSIGQFQQELINHVRNDIEALQEKFMQRYETSEAKRFADLRDIPPMSGKMVWARQIKRQLNILIQRLENVLGGSWTQHRDGRQLKSVCDELMHNLDTNRIFMHWLEGWKQDLSRRSTQATLNLYLLTASADCNGVMQLALNFDMAAVSLFKEIRHLEWLGFEIPEPALKAMSKIWELGNQSAAHYPHAVALAATLRTREQVIHTLQKKTLEPLLVPQLREVRRLVLEAFRCTVNWASPDTQLQAWVTSLADSVFSIQHRAHELEELVSLSDSHLFQMEDCPLSKLGDEVAAIQSIIDQMSLSRYSNIQSWVQTIDARVEDVLTRRLEGTVSHWLSDTVGLLRSEDEEQQQQQQPLDHQGQDFIKHAIVIQDQVLLLDPPLEHGCEACIDLLQSSFKSVADLPRLHIDSFAVFEGSQALNATYAIILKRLNCRTLCTAYSRIQALIHRVDHYVNDWLCYQSLWDTKVQDVARLAGSDVDIWIALLQDVKSSRREIEKAGANACFGPFVIDVSRVQAKAALKFDAWQYELLHCFGSLIALQLGDLYERLMNHKFELERATLEGLSTCDVISSILLIQEMQTWSLKLDGQLKQIDLGVKLLRRQRCPFPTDFPQISVSLGIASDFKTVLARRTAAVKERMLVLQELIATESKNLVLQVETLLQEWGEARKMGGGGVGLSPSTALGTIHHFSGLIERRQEELEKLSKSRQFLGLEALSEKSRASLSSSLLEVEELREVWTHLIGPHEKMAELLDMPWVSVVPNKLRCDIESIAVELQSLPNRTRQYESYADIREIVNRRISALPRLTELKSGALRDRHWHTILSRLNMAAETTVSLQQLTLGTLWDAPLSNVSDVVVTAQGEMALEEFLREVHDFWMTQEVELVSHGSSGGRGVRIIRRWGALFTKLDEHLNSIASMKMSPYFAKVPEFLEDAALWEDRLGRLQTIFDIWNDVQRKWVYLEGVFFSNEDIRVYVPAEYARFKAVDRDFVALMRRIASRPSILELLSSPHDAGGGLLNQLERQSNNLSKIQKSLGDYLESQRAAFSRFYFVGDEDLLEIIGNCSEPVKIAPHLSKMFAGMAGVNVSSSSASTAAAASAGVVVVDILSKDGEVVCLEEPVTVGGKGPIEWLGHLEHQMRFTIYSRLCVALSQQKEREDNNDDVRGGVVVTNTLYEDFPAQVGLLASQVEWCAAVEASLPLGILKDVENGVNAGLQACTAKLANSCMPVFQRCKYERLLVERVHQRDKTNGLVREGICTASDFAWQRVLRFRVSDSSTVDLKDNCVCVHMADAVFDYGFEYLGIGETLVQTPLTDRCYLMLTQALKFRMGGNPFGPAGTGKTESIKNLGALLGRFVLVFNCDERFDYNAMGRLFAGICQVGAWGCFDEFNRLEERILSAVSQQILTIQRGLQMQSKTVDLSRSSGTPPVALHPNLGILITMNPDYEGRSNLPDNLKQLFRAIAMVAPDRSIIVRVLLFSQGLMEANVLSNKITLLFLLCEEQLSRQNHYDFGLRALKSVVVGAGRLHRLLPYSTITEENVLLRSICETVTPKLVASDRPIFMNLVSSVFPGCDVGSTRNANLYDALISVCKERKFDYYSDENEWMEKILQLNSILEIRHGVMLVGPSGSGKSSAWKTLLSALEIVDGYKGTYHVIDAKALSKDLLYGQLDSVTLEWTDGVFTKLLRDVIVDPWGGGANKRHWIVFDGDVDPEWAENLNSVLDDNKLLTLPSGERLELPPNLRILIETDELLHTTPATISRCGMVWFSSDTVTPAMALKRALLEVKAPPNVQNNWLPEFLPDGGAIKALEWALTVDHIMNVTQDHLIGAVCSLLKQWVAIVADYNDDHVDTPMSDAHLATSSRRWLLYSLFWGLGSSMRHEHMYELSKVVLSHVVMQPPGGEDGGCGPDIDEIPSLLDVRVDPSNGVWKLWAVNVPPQAKLESHHVLTQSDVMITTVDTARHTEVLRAWILSRRPVILCGPPGSGKTMTLTATLKAMPDVVLANLSFSTSTSPSMLLKTFAQYCDVVRASHGLVMQPSSSFGSDKWVVVFCDEINLPAEDAYGTQTTLTFLRQLIEYNGFWRSEDCTWVTLDRIQFVGACNPPTDAGRVTLSNRFLRHTSLLFVDFPTLESLHQIYSTFNSALLQLHPSLRSQIVPLTDAMIDVYTANQHHFTPDTYKHYVYSPRELSRWVRAICEYISPLDSVSEEELVRIWAHEALRLFCDRLVDVDERVWCESTIDEIARHHFPAVPCSSALKRPILFSSWLSQHSKSVDKDVLHDFLSARLRIFYEEEMDVPLILFDDALEHVLRIDRVLRQRMGHLLLVGESGVGKSVLSQFVCWMNGMSIYQLKTTQSYTLEQFDEDLRGIIRRAGCQNERLCFIFDESNIKEASFMERMNALLASGEIPGLFVGDDYKSLITACRESASCCHGVSSSVDESDEELYRFFMNQVQQNLHVVFTMNPASDNFQNRYMASPALFNRCIVDWFGTWGDRALTQVAAKHVAHIDADDPTFELPLDAVESLKGSAVDLEELQPVTAAVVIAMVRTHTVAKAAAALHNRKKQLHYHLNPRDFLDFIAAFIKLLAENRSSLEDQQLHVNIGLRKLAETQKSVATMQHKLESKETNLKEKNEFANSKLEKMVEGHNEAERRKADAESLRRALEVQKIEIATRQEEAQRELSEAEPALLAAQTSVRSIRKTQLDEIRAMARPPKAVQTVLEAVSIMLGHADHMNWSDIRKIIAKQDYIATVLNFDADNLTQERITAITDMLERESDLDQDSVQHASRACGPLYAWVMSTINFNRIAQRVAPLREQVADLEKKSEVLATEKLVLEQEIRELEENILEYKQEYAESIRDVETIKVEMTSVKQRVHRAEALLQNLIEEKKRWTSSREGFTKQIFTLIGDCLLGAAFLTYAGTFDFRTRISLVSNWNFIMSDLNIKFRKDLRIIDYLSRTADRLEWASQGLPQDVLAIENAIILERFNRFPLVVDPSGQATAFLMAKYKHRNIVKTSFLDHGAGFLKTLGSAIRFGTPLLIEDAEAIDPILNPVLNREVQRTGGRTLIRLGGEDMDYSPQFLVILSTRDPVACFSPDLCSRVTLVNFTVTPSRCIVNIYTPVPHLMTWTYLRRSHTSFVFYAFFMVHSLQNQSLQMILRSERPDIESQRAQVIQLQGEQSVKLRTLEERLLDTISTVQGEILEDNTVMGVLEDLKVEAGDVVQEVRRISEVMAEIQATSRLYEPISLACSNLYFAMAALSDVHRLYQFSLQLFLSILSDVLKQPQATPLLNEENDKYADAAAAAAPITRLAHLNSRLYAEISCRVGWSLLKDDKLAFSLRLAQIFLLSGCTPNESSDQPHKQELDFLLYGSFGRNHVGAAAVAKHQQDEEDNDNNNNTNHHRNLLMLEELHLTNTKHRELRALTALPSCTELANHIKECPEKWKAFMSCDVADAVQSLPNGWISSQDASNPNRNALLNLLVVQTLRPEAMLEASSAFLNSIFGSDFQWDRSLDIGAVTDCSSPHSPILLVCEAGYDAGHNVESLASSRGMKLTSIAMGSAEGFSLADRSLLVAAKEGSWVLLQNCHVCPQWLDLLEKRLHGLSSVHNDFHLFLTADINATLPNSLVLASEVAIVEVPSGLRSGTLRFYREHVDDSMSAANTTAPPSTGGGLVAPPPHPKQRTTNLLPVEVNRIHALLAWLHAIMIERLRYVPVGWSKRYEFSQTDALCAVRTVNDWMINAAASRLRGGGGGRRREGGGSGGSSSSHVVPLSGQQHVSPDDIPWPALSSLLKESIYGGKVDNDYDRRILYSFIDSLFTPSSFDLVFSVAPGVTLPDSSSHEAFVEWAENLPHSNPTSWLGMGPGAEISLLLSRGRRVTNTLLALQDNAVGSSSMMNVEGGGTGEYASRQQLQHGFGIALPVDGSSVLLPSLVPDDNTTICCLNEVQALAEMCLSRLPTSELLPVLNISKETIATTMAPAGALWRCIGQETTQVLTLTSLFKDNLNMVVEFCASKIKSTNEIRHLIENLSRGIAPEAWTQYEAVYAGANRSKHHVGIPVTIFIEDLAKRLSHLKNYVMCCGGGDPTIPFDRRSHLLRDCKFWLGGLSNPKAFLTSMRQHVSQDLKCPLENLLLYFSAKEDGAAAAPINTNGDDDRRFVAFAITGIVLQGAGWENGLLTLSNAHEQAFNTCWFSWVVMEGDDDAVEQQQQQQRISSSIELPMYLAGDRVQFLATVHAEAPSCVPIDTWYQRGVALIVWNPST